MGSVEVGWWELAGGDKEKEKENDGVGGASALL